MLLLVFANGPLLPDFTSTRNLCNWEKYNFCEYKVCRVTRLIWNPVISFVRCSLAMQIGKARRQASTPSLYISQQDKIHLTLVNYCYLVNSFHLKVVHYFKIIYETRGYFYFVIACNSIPCFPLKHCITLK